MVLCPKLWIWIPGGPRSSNPEFQTKYHSITPSFTAKRSQSIGDACGTLSEPHPALPEAYVWNRVTQDM